MSNPGVSRGGTLTSGVRSASIRTKYAAISLGIPERANLGLCNAGIFSGCKTIGLWKPVVSNTGFRIGSVRRSDAPSVVMISCRENSQNADMVQVWIVKQFSRECEKTAEMGKRSGHMGWRKIPRTEDELVWGD